MKLYDSVGPNPHVVRMVLAEKGLTVPVERIDIRTAENRRAPFLAISPLGELPVLELDDGTRLTEVTAIAEYLDETHPAPPLLGTTPFERAETRMWVRRLDLNVVLPLINGYRYGEGADFFKDRIRTIPEAAPGMKLLAHDRLAWLDGQMAGRPWIVGGRFTLADILLFCFTRFAGKVGQPLDPAWTTLAAWFGRVQARPSARA